MPKRMLIDASHPEETRVVVLDGHKVEEFDFEAASKRPLKGNIYLAKVTRVEPSLQAAFVEYGGNRQGFLAFSEIHPDYYQIPVADRQALLAEQEADARRHAEDEFEAVETAKVGSAPRSSDSEVEEEEASEQDDETGETESGESEPTPTEVESGFDVAQSPLTAPQDGEPPVRLARFADIAEQEYEQNIADEQAAAEIAPHGPDSHLEAAAAALSGDTSLIDEEMDQDIVDEQAAAESSHVPDHGEEGGENKPAQALQRQRPGQRWMRRRHYKIQEVIKRRQIILVQVVKEERGNKGAALTTYLSLAGRYCVLMPNTPRGGGISRKITNANDRKRLKSAAAALELPDGMGLIIRTAGENRTKLEIKRDYEYLLRLWDQIRETTLASNAPACVHEEGDLIKRAIRDLYNKDVSEVLVEGDDGYRNAKDFMRMLMPSHAKNVKPYKESVPLYQRHQIEPQLDAMFQPTVTLKSGGYIVINQTEALVAIDVNSGRATREHSIEDTATKTNLEAADEIGRQLRLRDLAGLIVIDFIDMEDGRNDRAVEKRLHNAVRHDRARVQIGKISQFGLLEMSRQRLRAGVIAGSTVPCPHCEGLGIVRSVESTSLRLLRAVEEEGQKQRASAISVRAPNDVAIYTLNQKRRELARIETDYGMTIAFAPDPDIHAGHFEIDRTADKAPEDRRVITVTEAIVAEEEPEEVEAAAEVVADEEAETGDDRSSEEQPGEARRGGRRRRRRRGGRDRDRPLQEPVSATSVETADLAPEESEFEGQGHSDEQNLQGDGRPNGDGGRKRRRRRRGRRGRHDGNGDDRQGAPSGEGVPVDASVQDSEGAAASFDTGGIGGDPFSTVPNAPSEPVWSLTAEPPREPATAYEKAEAVAAPLGGTPVEPAATVESPASASPAEPVAAVSAEIAVMENPEAPPVTAPPEPETPPGPPRKGWWQRTFKS